MCATLRRFERNIQLPPGYEACFQRAIWTFRHQRVYCPQQRRVVHLTDIPEGGLADGVEVPEALPAQDDCLAFLGAPLPDDVARGIADGACSQQSCECVRAIHLFTLTYFTTYHDTTKHTATLDPFTHEPLCSAPIPHHGRAQSAPMPQSRTPWTIAAASAPRTLVLPVCYAHGNGRPASTTAEHRDVHGTAGSKAACGPSEGVLCASQQAASSGSAPTVLHALSQLEFGGTSQEQSGTTCPPHTQQEVATQATDQRSSVEDTNEAVSPPRASTHGPMGRFLFSKRTVWHAEDGKGPLLLHEGPHALKENTPPRSSPGKLGHQAKATKRRRMGAPVNQQFKQPWKSSGLVGPFAKFVCRRAQERDAA